MIADIFNPSINQLQVALAFDLDRVQMNQHDKSLGRTSFSPKNVVRVQPGDRHTEAYVGPIVSMQLISQSIYHWFIKQLTNGNR